MGKRIHHMGMTLTKEDHDRWHEEAAELTPKQHEALMKELGTTKEQDEEWHRTHEALHEQRIREPRASIRSRSAAVSRTGA